MTNGRIIELYRSGCSCDGIAKIMKKEISLEESKKNVKERCKLTMYQCRVIVSDAVIAFNSITNLENGQKTKI